jgi:hypothetical protein
VPAVPLEAERLTSMPNPASPVAPTSESSTTNGVPGVYWAGPDSISIGEADAAAHSRHTETEHANLLMVLSSKSTMNTRAIRL